MDYRFNKTLLVILSLSSLLLSSNAVPSTRVIDFIPTSVPAKAPSSIDFISTSFPAIDAPKSGVESLAAKVVSRVATKIDPEISRICTEGEDKTDGCIEILSKLLQGRFDVVKALEIEVNATLGTAKSIFATIIKLREDPKTDKRAIDALDICRDQYDLMLDSINQALDLLPQQNFVDAYNKMSAVISYKSSCQEAWDESPGVERPWDVETLIQSTVICLDIFNNIINHHKF